MGSYSRYDNARLRKLINGLPGRADELVRGAAQEINNEIVLSFGTSPENRTTGERDTRGRFTKGQLINTRSKPGYPPNVDTGALRASMRWQLVGQRRAIVYTGVLYAHHLEMGTERMAARPFIYPVFARWNRGYFEQFMRRFGVFNV